MLTARPPDLSPLHSKHTQPSMVCSATCTKGRCSADVSPGLRNDGLQKCCLPTRIFPQLNYTVALFKRPLKASPAFPFQINYLLPDHAKQAKIICLGASTTEFSGYTGKQRPSSSSDPAMDPCVTMGKPFNWQATCPQGTDNEAGGQIQVCLGSTKYL